MTDGFQPAYLGNITLDQLSQRAHVAHQRLLACDVCPRRCKVNRLESSKQAHCQTGELAEVASYGPHLGEENPLRGYNGSGTIFFAHCNLNCVFCQNFDISQHGYGRPVTAEQLASMMLELQDLGCHNINLVSPTHVVPQILAAVLVAAHGGLHIPLVYNSGGYDTLETLALLDGVVDIYMPDIKYADPDIGQRFSGIPNYPQVNQLAIKEMHRQVGDLLLNDRGIARRGLLVRHLVLPNNLAGTPAVVRFLAKEVSTNTYLNIMDQYRPCFQADRFPELSRRASAAEYNRAVTLALNARVTRLDRRHQRIL